MIFWGIILGILALTIGFCFLLEFVNGTNNLRFWFCIAGLFFGILIGIFTIGSNIQSREFYTAYDSYYQKIEETKLNSSQEYAVLGRVVVYNNKLYDYQKEIKAWGFLSPVYKKVKTLKPITLEAYDTSKYIW